MLQLEDILDDAARYLRREMDTEETAFFEELINQYPYLWEDIRLMGLVLEGLRDLNGPGKKSPPDSKKPNPSSGGQSI